jgi:hypothetical protein
MDDNTKKEADRRFEEALEASGARDPRDFYRKTLRQLREANPEGYERAVGYFQNELVPSVAAGTVEPIGAWREYGRIIAEVCAEGRTVAIDETGRLVPYDPGVSMDWLVLHLPKAKGGKALLVALPPEPSTAQRATYDLLVIGKHTVSAPS